MAKQDKAPCLQRWDRNTFYHFEYYYKRALFFPSHIQSEQRKSLAKASNMVFWLASLRDMLATYTSEMITSQLTYTAEVK